MCEWSSLSFMHDAYLKKTLPPHTLLSVTRSLSCHVIQETHSINIFISELQCVLQIHSCSLSYSTHWCGQYLNALMHSYVVSPNSQQTSMRLAQNNFVYMEKCSVLYNIYINLTLLLNPLLRNTVAINYFHPQTTSTHHHCVYMVKVQTLQFTTTYLKPLKCSSISNVM